MVLRLSVDRGAFFLRAKMSRIAADFFGANLNANNHFCLQLNGCLNMKFLSPEKRNLVRFYRYVGQ